MTDETPNTSLNDAQMARAEALAVARSALCDMASSPITGREALPKRFGPQDLFDLAQWILDGTDPMAAYRDEQARSTPITVVVVPDDVVEAVSRLNPAENFRPGGLLIVPESVDHSRVTFEES